MNTNGDLYTLANDRSVVLSIFLLRFHIYIFNWIYIFEILLI